MVILASGGMRQHQSSRSRVALATGVAEETAGKQAVYQFLAETAGKYMTRDVKTVTRHLSVREVNDMLERDDFNSYPVEENGKVVGIITKFDLLNCFAFTPNQMLPRYADLMNRTVADVMTSDFTHVRPDTKLTRVLQLMVQHRIRSIPVIDADERLAGIISREDVLKALAATADSP